MGRRRAGLQTLGLLQLVVAVEAGVHPALGQVEHATGTLQVLLGHVHIGIGQAQLVVGAADVGGQRQACGLAIHFTGAGAAECGLPGGALATPEVEAVAAAHIELAQGAVTVTLADRIVWPRQTRAGHARIGVDLWIAIGIGGEHRGIGLAAARIGFLQRGAVTQGLADQVVELRIAQPRPPVGARPLDRGEAIAGKGGVALEGGRIHGVPLGVQPFGRHAAGQQQGGAEGGQWQAKGHGSEVSRGRRQQAGGAEQSA